MSDLTIDLSDFAVGHDADVGREGPGSPDQGGRPGGSGAGPGRRLRLAAILVPCLAVVPFLLLLRGGVHAHAAWGWSPWPAVLSGVALGGAGLGLLTWLVLLALGMPGAVRRVLSRGALLLAVAYAGYGLVYVAARHAKGPEVRSEYRRLHPLLRLASTTLFLVDGDAVVTDASREPADYRAMGLTPRESSLHFPQADGYVHALDLRTAGRPGWRNLLVSGAFRIMGFRTLRHVGTADHLHVSLPGGGR